MYGKIFDSMYEGTLYGHWQAIVTLQQMLVLCDASGVIDMMPQHISARTSIPLEIITKGIEVLSAPDPYSRTPGEDGVRIKLLEDRRPWGWYIVNHAKYKSMVSHEEKREADRTRIAEKRKAEKDNKNNNVADCRKQSQCVAEVAHTDTDTDTDTKIKDTSPEPSAPSPAFLEIPLVNKGAVHVVTVAKVAEWQASFPAIDVEQTLRTIRQWNIDNPANRKTAKGIEAHISRWLAKEQNSARTSQAPASAPKAVKPLTCQSNSAGQLCGMPAKNHGGVIECEGCYTKRISSRGIPANLRTKLGLSA